jgi:dimethylaniline monooxygenase (N-oxide forming)
VSSRQLTTFSDFRLPEEADFLSAQRYLQYLNDYCTHFSLWQHIHCSCQVIALDTMPGGTGHVLTYVGKDGQQQNWECDAVAICSGLHVQPNIPRIEGIEHVPIKFHSSEFKKREQFGVNTTVLVLGSGETASDITYLAVTSPTARVVMCHRSVSENIAILCGVFPEIFRFCCSLEAWPAISNVLSLYLSNNR